MAASKRSSGFWTGGYRAYAAALQADFEAELADLRRQLREAQTLPERERLKTAIRETKRIYRQKSRDAEHHLH
jgi:hypothetical protein